jgi:hypothetical protein
MWETLWREVPEVKSENQGKHWGTSNTSMEEAILGPHQVRTAMVMPAYIVGTSPLAVLEKDQ